MSDRRSRSVSEICAAVQVAAEMYNDHIDEAATRREIETLSPQLVEALAVLASFAPPGGEL